jgi:hypothetical protein
MYAQEKDGLDRKPVPEIRSFTKQSVTEDNLTDVVLERWKDIPDPRLRQIIQSLIKHLHGFVREIEDNPSILLSYKLHHPLLGRNEVV